MKKHLAITEIEIPETEVSGDEEEEEESTELPEITPEMQKQISQSLSSPPNVTLVECYRYVEFSKIRKVPKSDPNSKIGFFSVLGRENPDLTNDLFSVQLFSADATIFSKKKKIPMKT